GRNSLGRAGAPARARSAAPGQAEASPGPVVFRAGTAAFLAAARPDGTGLGGTGAGGPAGTPTGAGMISGSISRSRSRPGLGVIEACRTALVTTSETRRQASSDWPGSMPQARQGWAASRLA